MEPFIDIHTHSIQKQENAWKLCNIFPEQEIPEMSFSIGIHPWEIAENWQVQMQQVVAKSQLQNCKALGECGLDKMVKTPLKIQQAVFKAHIDWANELQKPLIIHCVKAYDELLKFVNDIQVPVIVHDFGKSVELGKQLQEKGIYLSIGKAVFRTSFGNVLPQLDKQLLFLETDDTEYSIVQIYKQTAKIFQCDLLTLQQQIHRNFKKVF